MDGPFSGRVALITGTSGGIGQAPARRPATGGAVPGLG
jgi:NAD(P)-dependent dehydrogenase (short-subunit alcohol dehydrogenase family)